LIRGLCVSVLEDKGNGFATQLKQILTMTDEELQKLSSFREGWKLEPAEDGVVCNGGYLHHKEASEKQLSWSVMTGSELPFPEGDVAAPIYTWVRAEN